MAVTTNGSSGNQTFGISSGTLGCDKNGMIKHTAQLGMFTGSNMEKLALDMSAGAGESLETLADLMGVEAADKAAFFAAMQQNFSNIFSADDVSAQDVITSVHNVMSNDSRLVRYVS